MLDKVAAAFPSFTVEQIQILARILKHTQNIFEDIAYF